MVLFLRNITPVRQDRRLLLGAGSFTILWSVTAFIVSAAECGLPTPWSYFNGHCINGVCILLLQLRRYCMKPLNYVLGHLVELGRTYEHLHQSCADRPACVDYVESEGFSFQEILCGVHIRPADHVNAPRYSLSSMILTELLGSASPRLVSLSTRTKLNTPTT